MKFKNWDIAALCIAIIALICVEWQISHKPARWMIASKFRHSGDNVNLSGNLDSADYGFRDRNTYFLSKGITHVGRGRYYINPSFYFGKNWKSFIGRPNQFSENDALKIAWVYVQNNFPKSAEVNNLTVPVPGGIYMVIPPFPHVRFYEFSFNCAPPGTSLGPTNCWVVINSVSGQVMTHDSTVFPVTTSSRPSITVKEAIQTAISRLVSNGRNAKLKSIQITVPDNEGTERLLYNVSFEGTGPSPGGNYPPMGDYLLDGHLNQMYAPPPTIHFHAPSTSYNFYRAVVDAHTGELIAWNFESSWPQNAIETHWTGIGHARILDDAKN